MHKARARSYPISIFIAGDFLKAKEICQKYCDEKGLCVTVTPTEYIYTGGTEPGVVVGMINYPRFPKYPHQQIKTAQKLAMRLLEGLDQQSFSIETPQETHWFSNRPEDLKQYEEDQNVSVA